MLNAAPCMLGPGAVIEIDSKRCQILSIKNDKIHLEYEDDSQELMSRDVMSNYILANKVKFDVIKDNVVYVNTDPELTKEMQVMQAYLNALDCVPNPGTKDTRIRIIKEVGEELKIPVNDRIKYSTLRNKFLLWKENDRNIFALFKKQKRNRESSFDTQLTRLIDEVIEDQYLTRGGPSEAECLRIIESEFKARGIGGNCIKKTWFNKLINDLDPYEVALARKGKNAAKSLANKSTKMIHADFFGQVIEVDACHLEVGIVCEKTGIFLGTLIVYVAIDRCTRYVLGYAMSIKGNGCGESVAAVLDMFKHMVFPKKHSFHTEYQWDGYGRPILIICDAGKAFNNRFIKTFVANIQSSIKTAEAGKPEKKPFIERFFLTLRMQYAIKLPGYRKKRKLNIEYQNSLVKDSCLLLSEAKELFEKYVLDHYHQAQHKGLEGESPYLAHQRETKNMIPQPPVNPEQIEAFKGVDMIRTLQAGKGIQIDKLYYSNDELFSFYLRLIKGDKKRENPKVTVLFNENDVSEISVVDAERMELIVCPCTNESLKPGTTLAEVKAKRATINQGKKAKAFGHSNETLALVSARQKAILLEVNKSKPKRKRAKPVESTEVSTDAAVTTIDTRNQQMVANYGSYSISSSFDITQSAASYGDISGLGIEDFEDLDCE